MKYLLITALLTFTIFLISQESGNSNGLTSIVISDTTSQCDTTNTTETTFYYNEKENTMTLIFSEDALVSSKSELLIQLKDKLFFHQETSIELPEDFSKELGSAEQIIIQPGTYKILHTNNIYKILIPLKQKIHKK